MLTVCPGCGSPYHPGTGCPICSPRNGSTRAHRQRRVRKLQLQNACVECGSRKNLELDHVIPLSKGGRDTDSNTRILCRSCNRRKGANDA